jgi:hypothetical protein
MYHTPLEPASPWAAGYSSFYSNPAYQLTPHQQQQQRTPARLATLHVSLLSIPTL